MKQLTIEDAKRLLGARVFKSSYALFTSGKKPVENYSVKSKGFLISVSGDVHAPTLHSVSLDFGKNDEWFTSNCNCITMRVYGMCDHVGVLMLHHIFACSSSAPSTSLEPLFSAYAPKFPEKADPVRLTPVIGMEDNGFTAAFKIGRDKSYLIKKIMEFTLRMRSGEIYEYGEGFAFEHDLNAFDPRSRLLCRFIIDKADSFTRLVDGKSMFVQQYFGDIRHIPLSGADFDMLFELFSGEKLPSKGSGKTWSLLDENPPLTLISNVTKQGATLKLDKDARVYFSGTNYYAVVGNCIYKMHPDYASDMAPLIDNALSDGRELSLTPSQTQRFCMTVAPRICAHTGENALVPLAPYMPEELETRFYVDLPEKNRLTARPNFTYGDKFVEAGSSERDYPDIRRNIPLENAALEALGAYFDSSVDKDTYELTDEDKIYDFLKTGADKLSAVGQVFISDRLKALTTGAAPHPTVNARVKGGMLELTLDTDEFPGDELEALMKSVREKRKFYRLKNGAFMNLEDGAFSAFTQVFDSLGINGKSATAGASVPLYKALFLDDALKADKAVRLEKDINYKRLMRDFKSVEDGDFPPPESLEKVMREYQKIGYAWLRTLDKYGFGGILADDMGLGKTLQVLACISALKQENPEGTYLILCPASVIISWAGECAKWVPELKTGLILGSATERGLIIKDFGRFNILISSYDSFRNDCESHKNNQYRMCVLDEAQYIKNHETKLNKCVKSINARTRLALSGTPVENRLSELWSIFDFIMPGYLGKYASFREKYETPITEREDKTASSLLSKLVRPFILRRMKQDVLNELPPKTEINCYIQMDEAQRKLYLAYVNEVKKRMESAQASDKLLILSMLTRLRQICCDPRLCVENYEGDSCKLDECVRMVEELTQNGHRVLIFSQFTQMLARIDERLASVGISTFTLRGDTPLSERARLVKAFNEGDTAVFLISLKAGGTGLNLTGADTVIHYDPWWNISAQNQATDRCYRIGQDKPVQVYKLIASNTIEENIVNLQSKKLSLARTVTENADGSLMSMTSEELLELIK